MLVEPERDAQWSINRSPAPNAVTNTFCLLILETASGLIDAIFFYVSTKLYVAGSFEEL